MTRRSCRGLVRTLDPALGRAAVGANDVDVQLVQRPAELGHAVPAHRAGLVDPEGGVLVRVEGNRFAVHLQVLTGGLEIVEGRLGVHEPQMQEPAGGIVNVDQQRASRSAVLEPPMLRAVDLDQVAHTVPAIARLMNRPETLLAVGPEPVRQHPLPDRLAGQVKAVALSQLLGGKCRAEVGVVLADEAQSLVAQPLRMAPVAWASAPA